MKKFKLDCTEGAIRKSQAIKYNLGFAKTVGQFNLLIANA